METEKTREVRTGKNDGNKKNLLDQIIKFGIVGGIAFLIDFAVYKAVNSLLPFDKGYIVAGVAGFSISLIFNYLASMRFVFERKEENSRKKEFMIFLILSLIGLGLNELFLLLYVEGIDKNLKFIHYMHEIIYNVMDEKGIKVVKSIKEVTELFAKIFATALVMVYNFISRKMTLEKKVD
ncbi:MAG: GtrA family protein [Lachnospiraceae bacterium]|nr:GtrA family protein [Lachnospiraceae bacterium]